ncbi:MAG: type II secretion system minor pseudopilin GspJ [Pseudomonadota bacterium]|nr:type II secretion system minor pseudopilin GspJ [Pseudomonadota bacterium]
MRRKTENGFTLVELLVSLFIFGMLSAAGVALLSFSVRAQEVAEAQLSELAEVRRAGALLTSDLAQATARIARDQAGTPQPAFVGGSGGAGIAFAFVRRGWENYDGSPRASIQKVEYRLVADRVERVAYPFVDGAGPAPAIVLIDRVSRVAIRYRDEEGEWRERWDPEVAVALPRAIELVMDVEGSGTVRQLFLTGTPG